MKYFLFLFFSLPVFSYSAEPAKDTRTTVNISHCSHSGCHNCGKLKIDGSFRNYTSLKAITTPSTDEHFQEKINTSKGGLYDFKEKPYEKRIREINASQNPIISIKPSALKNFSHLRILSLASVGLTQLAPQIFHGAFRLTHLDISHNTLENLPDDIFDTLLHLKTLLLHNNKLETVPENIFFYTRNLQYLHAHNNLFKEIPAALFHLRLKENKAGKETKRKKFIKEIHLSGNSLTSLDESLTRDIKKIALLDIQNNSFKECPAQKTQNARTKNFQSPITKLLCDCPYGNH